MATWSIVTTVREDKQILIHFIDHHLKLGCGKIYMYFDDPNDPFMDIIATFEKVIAFKSIDSSDIKSHERRQSCNASDAYIRCSTDWLIHLDSDELLYSEILIDLVLDSVSPKISQLILSPREAIYRSFSDSVRPFASVFFRMPISKEVQGLLYPEAKGKMRMGFTGHTKGKSFVRSGISYVKGGIHRWRDNRPKIFLKSIKAGDGILLLHFDAVSFRHWKDKLTRRVVGEVRMAGMGNHRRRQLRHFRNLIRKDDEDGMIALFSNLYILENADSHPSIRKIIHSY